MRVLLATATAAVATLVWTAIPTGVAAHFQSIHTPEVVWEQPTELSLRLVFNHPFSNGYTMDMGTPEAFFVVQGGKRTELLSAIQPITWTGAINDTAAFEGSYPVKGDGSYIFVLQPAPYFEESQDKYINRIAKALEEKGVFPTDWSEPIGLPAEIVPLSKPHSAYVGSAFSGAVLSGGVPVAGAEADIEYVAVEPDLMTYATKKTTTVRPPQHAVMGVRAVDLK